MGNYYLYVLAYSLTRLLPRKLAYVFAMLIADCHFYLAKTDRLAVEYNLKIALKSETVPWKAVRLVFRNFGKYLADFFMQTKYLDSKFMARHVHVRNTEYLNEVLAQKKGCIVISAHLGNWELAGAVLSKLGYPLSIIALPHQDVRVNQFFNQQREFFGITVIPTNTSIRHCIEHLRDNRIVAILAERDFTQHGIRLSFLGKQTMIPKGAAMFSLKTGAPIIPAFFLRTDDDDFQIEFHEPIYPPDLPKGKLNDKDIEQLMRQYIHIIENQIRKHPNQWLNFRKFDV